MNTDQIVFVVIVNDRHMLFTNRDAYREALAYYVDRGYTDVQSTQLLLRDSFDPKNYLI